MILDFMIKEMMMMQAMIEIIINVMLMTQKRKEWILSLKK